VPAREDLAVEGGERGRHHGCRKPFLEGVRVGGIPEVLGDKSIALAEPGDAASLAAVMARAMTDPAWLEKVMPDPNAFKERFSASVMSSSLTAFYREILASRHGPSRPGRSSPGGG
jgi:hypothetical protein